MEATATVARRRRPSVLTAAISGLLTLGALCVPAGAQADGTITATAGGTRSAVNADSDYASGLAGVTFQKAAWVIDPATATWSALCTTDATGACTSANLADGRYLVRQAPGGAPAGWRALTTAAWGGSSSGASPIRDYVGDATVNGAGTTVHPSTAWAPTAASSSSGRLVAAKDNPALPGRCGLDVLLLLDRSGSIGPQKDTYRDAAKQFVSALSGTPTRLKISSFGPDATADQATFVDLGDPADVAIANTKIDSVYASPAGGTNWDAGMKLAAGAGVDVVVFITDGNPTLRDTGGTGSTVNLLDLTSGVASANKVKIEGKSAQAGATILAVGAGTGVTASNLAAVSGPTEGTDYVTASVAGLEAKLQELANGLCGTWIHVRKLTDEGVASAPKAGWTFTAGKPTGSPVTFSAGSVVTAGSPAESVIAVKGIPAGGASAITVTETQQAGYAFVASQCRTGGFADVTAGGALTTTIPTVHRGEDWYCTYRNRTIKGTVAIDASGPAPAAAVSGQSTDEPAVTPDEPTPDEPTADEPTLVAGASPTGTARLRGNSRCVAGPFSAKVTGRGIAQVRFLLDGKQLKTVKSVAGRTVFKVRITPSGSTSKSHRVTARVSFKRSANTRARSLRFVYVGCARQVVKPQYTG